MKKRFVLLCSVMFLVLSFSTLAFAGDWKQDTTGWWYQNDDGSYPKTTWQVINEKQYYFNDLGYMLINTITPDGFFVGIDGAWDGQPAAPAVPIVDTTTSAASNTTTTTSVNTSKVSGISTSPYDGYTITVNTGTKKYHIPSCGSVSDIKSNNLGYCDNSAYLDAQGYAACKRCH